MDRDIGVRISCGLTWRDHRSSWSIPVRLEEDDRRHGEAAIPGSGGQPPPPGLGRICCGAWLWSALRFPGAALAVCGGSGDNGRRLLCRESGSVYMEASGAPTTRLNLLQLPVGCWPIRCACLLSQAGISKPVGLDHYSWTAWAPKPGKEPCANAGVGHLVGWADVCLGLAGDLWALLNPLERGLFGWAEALYRGVAPGGRSCVPGAYPPTLEPGGGSCCFLGFAWVELVFRGAAVPANLAVMALDSLSGITWTRMCLLGKTPGCAMAAFSLAFSLLAPCPN